MSHRLIDLSHPIVAGMTTYPGMPGPEIDTFISREESEQRLGTGVSFHVGRLCMVANTGTYLDAPFHYHADGADVSAVSLGSMVDLPALVVDARQHTAIGAGVVASAGPSRGAAVLIRTDWSRHWGSDAYLTGSPFLTEDAVEALVASDVALVGIDSLNIDDVADAHRPAHRLLLAAGILIVEHLTSLRALPPTGARFTAVPAPVVGLGTMPVRAYATVPG